MMEFLNRKNWTYNKNCLDHSVTCRNQKEYADIITSAVWPSISMSNPVKDIIKSIYFVSLTSYNLSSSIHVSWFT